MTLPKDSVHDLNDDHGNNLNGIHDANDDHPHGQFDVSDMSSGGSSSLTGDVYSGPVSGIDDEIILVTPKNLNVSATSQNVFIHTGGGDDAIRVLGGTNVLDGGTGSNFLTGGSGHDTFFIDDRGPNSDIWSTLVNFHAGDDVTVWGVTPQNFRFDWVDNQGATGFTGLTMHATAVGLPTASLTLAGYSSDDLHNGRLSVSFGHTDDQPGVPGSSYMVIHGS